MRRYSSNPYASSALVGVGGQHHAPFTLPMGKTRYLLYRRMTHLPLPYENYSTLSVHQIKLSCMNWGDSRESKCFLRHADVLERRSCGGGGAAIFNVVNYQSLIKLRYTSSGFWFSSSPTSFIRTDSLVQLNRSG